MLANANKQSTNIRRLKEWENSHRRVGSPQTTSSWACSGECLVLAPVDSRGSKVVQAKKHTVVLPHLSLHHQGRTAEAQSSIRWSQCRAPSLWTRTACTSLVTVSGITWKKKQAWIVFKRTEKLKKEIKNWHKKIFKLIALLQIKL